MLYESLKNRLINICCDFGVGFRIANKLKILESKNILPKCQYNLPISYEGKCSIECIYYNNKVKEDSSNRNLFFPFTFSLLEQIIKVY